MSDILDEYNMDLPLADLPCDLEYGSQQGIN